MKKITPIIIFLVTVLAGLYLAFLFVLPNCVNLNNYAPSIEKAFFDKTNLKIYLNDINITTSWDLKLSATVKKADLFNQEKFAQINNLHFKIALVPLIFKKIEICNIEADKFLANIDDELLTKIPTQKVDRENYQLSEKFADVKVGLYRISYLKGKNNYTIKGHDLDITEFLINKNVKIKTNGSVILNGVEHITYDVKLTPKLLDFLHQQKEDSEKSQLDLIECLDNILKYKVFCNINSNLNISGDKDDIKLKGNVNVDNLQLTCEGKKSLPSNIDLKFNNKKVAIEAILRVSKQAKLNINGLFDNDKSKKVDLNVISDDINIEEISALIKTIGKSFGIEQLQEFDLKGHLRANFNIKSDLKKVNSTGYLSIKNASVYDKKYKILVDKINTDIDFSRDSININKAVAELEKQPITINGKINHEAYANITVLSNDLKLKNISGINKLSAGNALDGILTFNVSIIGQLKNAVPKLSANIKNLCAVDKKTKARLNVASVNINGDLAKNITAKINVQNANFAPDSQTSMLIPRLVLTLADNKLLFEKTTLWVNNIRTDLSGAVSNIDKNPTMENVAISIPNYTSIPLKGYPSSKLTIKGDLKANGTFAKPSLNGYFSMPLIYIPTLSFMAKDASLRASDRITFNCSSAKVANSTFNVNADINKNFQNGLVINNLNINGGYVNLDELLQATKKQKDSMIPFSVNNGKLNVTTVRQGNITAENILATINAKNGIFYLKNITGTAFLGQIAGNASYDMKREKTSAQIQGRDLSAKLAVPAITNHKDDISGKLDFDSSISFVGSSTTQIKKTLSGNMKLQIRNGKLGMLGKLEHLLYAQNVVADSFLKASLNLATRALMTKNTGFYKYLQGDIKLKNGVANVNYIKTSGPSMSLLMKGRYYLPENYAVLTIFGRMSNDVVNVLGPIGEFTLSKAISSILKQPEKSKKIYTYLTGSEQESYSQIPPLSVQTEFKTKEFRVVINGDPYKQTSVLSFEWIVKPSQSDIEIINSKQQTKVQSQTLPDFVKKLPDYEN